MKNDVAIKVEGVYKSFKLPHEKTTSIKSAFLGAIKKERGYETQHVLEDVSFEVKKGDFFGIVGRNGSGKSTLLKLISQIYTPDKGSITVNGSLTPFIELGVGFNPELTGRENVYLNGALLGFNNKEMAEMYDDIVEFAELERFMDQKLKNYSSGMQVRLAFSIAIRANSDILVLDEVLAVGDEAFQRKCNEYFASIKGKQTVILVTHDMAAVRKFCTKAILIESGGLKAAGHPDDVAKQYTLDNLTTEDDGARGANQNERMKVTLPVELIEIVPRSSHIVTREEELKFDVVYKQIDDTPTYIGISLIYENLSIIEHNTLQEKPYYSKDGIRKYSYTLPLSRFTQGEFMITAAVLGEKGKNLLAFTSGSGNYSFIIASRDKKRYGGMLMEKGKWVKP